MMLCQICMTIWVRSDLMETNWARKKWPIRSLSTDSACEICRVIHGMWVRTPGFEAYKYGVAKGTIQKEPDSTNLECLRLSLDFVDTLLWKELSCAYTLLPVHSDAAGRDINLVGFDPKLVRSCFDHCDKRHDCLRANPIQQHNPGFHVIDANDMCIIQAPSNCSYVALSYVWGGIIQTRLRKSNKKLLEAKQGLEQEDLPKTIQDALNICRDIGVRYLWVDRLCIVQNSHCHTKSQVARMQLFYSQIYSGAYFTIIAATGGNSSSGISPPRPQRLIQHTARIRGATYTAVPNTLEPLESILAASVWATRAWTLQEFVLSRRCLIFAGDECFLFCGKGAYVPGLAKRHQLSSPVKFGTSLLGYRLPFGKGDGIIHRRYGRLASSYASRELSFPEDIERGFEGITTVLTPYLGQFRWGLPESIIRWAFCWMQPDGMMQRKGFPSYSWTGWMKDDNNGNSKDGNKDGIANVEKDQVMPWLSFPDSHPYEFWPPCSIYYWTSRTTMKPIPSRTERYKFARPKFGKEYDNTHLCNHDSTRWIWNAEGFSGKRWRSHRRYKRLLAVSRPAFKDVPSVDFRHVLTFASGLAVLAKQPKRSQVKMAPITPIPMFEQPALNLEEDIIDSELRYSSEQQQQYIFLGLLDHVAGIFAVIIPVTVDLLVPGTDGSADQLVVRRCGNPYRLRAETWFAHSLRCIVHYV